MANAFNEESKCSWCKNLLSIPPILLVNEELYCGRCKDIIYQRNSNPTLQQGYYENIAKKFQFPCRYKDDGCEEILRWGNVQEHEDKCSIGNMECLFNLEEFKQGHGCEWNGNNQDFWKHLDEVHPDLRPAQINKLEIWSEPKSRIFRLMLAKETFLLILHRIDNIYYLMLFGSNKLRAIEYKIEILDDTRKSLIFFNFPNVLHYNTSQMKKFGTKLEFNDIIPKYLTVFFGDVSRCRMANCELEVLPVCSICKEPITLPIYICEAAHSICGFCYQTRVRPYCFCGQVLRIDNNMNIDRSQEHYGCIFPNCFFHGNIFEMEFHLKACKCFYIQYNKEDISEFNTLYAKRKDRIFVLDNSRFLLKVLTEDNYLIFQLSSSRFSAIAYNFILGIHSTTSNLVTPHPISPEFYDFHLEKLHSGRPVKVSSTYFFDGIAYSLNFSKK